MAAPFLAGALTAHLLTEDKKPNEDGTDPEGQ